MIKPLLLALLLCGAGLAQADVYKCTQADGSLLYSDSPCAEGSSGKRMSQQEIDAHTSNLGRLAPSPTGENQSGVNRVTDKLQSSMTQVSEQQLPAQLQTKLPDVIQAATKNLSILFWLGLLIAFIGSIWLLISAFQTSIWWGLGYLLVPFVALIYIILHWADAKRPFLLNMLGVAIMLVAVFLNL